MLQRRLSAIQWTKGVCDDKTRNGRKVEIRNGKKVETKNKKEESGQENNRDKVDGKKGRSWKGEGYWTEKAIG